MSVISLKQLKENVAAFYKKGQSGYEKVMFMNLPSRSRKESFEIVSETKGSLNKVLIPCEEQYSVLFRGQNEDISPCNPSLYRGDHTIWDIFMERLRLAVLIELLNSHPIVKNLFIRRHWKVNYEGLAQHYGLKTAMLDFTSDIDVALFFAMCKYNSVTDTYEAVITENNVGVIYCISPIQMAMCDYKNLNLFSHEIEVIGLQAFERPALQRGFALRMKDGEDLRAWKCHFSYTIADSEEYLKKYDTGHGLWCNDILVDKVKEIKTMSAFTPQHFRKAYELAELNGISKGKMKAMLAKKKIHITSKALSPCFTNKEITAIIEKWNATDEQKFFSRLVSRKIITLQDSVKKEDGTIVGRIKNECMYMDANHLASSEMLRMDSTGCLVPKGFKLREHL